MLEGLNDQQREAVLHDGGPLLVVAGAGHREDHHPRPPRGAAHRARRAAPSASCCSPSLGEPRPSCCAGWTGSWAAPRPTARRPRGCGAARSTRWPPGCSASMGSGSACTPASPSTTGATPRTSSRCCGPSWSSGAASGASRGRRTCLDIYSRCVNSRAPLDAVLARAFPWCTEQLDGLKLLFRTYVDRKAEQRVLDYDDLLLFFHALLGTEAAGPAVRAQFDHVLVDEYQDTNALQAELLDRLCPGGRGLTVVGDDAQAIYGFRAATVRNILDFPALHPGTRTVVLAENYRSTPELLEATNRVIAQARERHPKELWSRAAVGRAAPSWSPAPTRPSRPSWCWVASSSSASRGWTSDGRRCSSAPRTTACSSRWSSAAAASPSTSTAACASWRRPTCEISWPSSASPRTRGTCSPARACSGSCPAWARGPRGRCSSRVQRDRQLRGLGGDGEGSRRRPAATGRRWSRSAASSAAPHAAGAPRPAPPDPVASTARSARSGTTTSPARLRDLEQLEQLAAGFADRAALPRRAHARAAPLDPGPRRPALARRRLPGPQHHPLGQGARVRRGVRDPRRRREHPLGPGHRQHRRRSTRSSASSTWRSPGRSGTSR